jgi:hypothetical protein
MTYQVYTNRCGSPTCNSIPNSFELTINLPPELSQYSPVVLNFTKTYSVWQGVGTATASECPVISISVEMSCSNGIISFVDMTMLSNGYYIDSYSNDLEFIESGGEINFQKIVILVNNHVASSNRCCCDNLKNKCEIIIPSFSIGFVKDPSYSFGAYLFLYYGLGEFCANIPPIE